MFPRREPVSIVIRRFVNPFPFFFFLMLFICPLHPSSPLLDLRSTKSKRRRKAFHTIRWLPIESAYLYRCKYQREPLARLSVQIRYSDGKLFTRPDVDTFDKFDLIIAQLPNWTRLRIYQSFLFIPLLKKVEEEYFRSIRNF